MVSENASGSSVASNLQYMTHHYNFKADKYEW